MSHEKVFREKDHRLKTFHSIEPIAARMSFHGKVHLIMNTEIHSKDLFTQRPTYSLTVTIRPSDRNMDRLCVTLIAFLCAVSSSQDGISAAEVEMRVRPGDNITLYCDCNLSSGIYIMWYRNCSHKYQPPLVILTKFLSSISLPGYNVVWNPSNISYDLLIENITESDLGLYYCGTVEYKFQEGKRMKYKELFQYGNITTRISLETSPPASLLPETSPPDCLLPEISPPEPSSSSPPPVDCGLCWMLVFSLCPVSALLYFACVYSFYRTTAPTETQVPLNWTSTWNIHIYQYQQSVRPIPVINTSRVRPIPSINTSRAWDLYQPSIPAE
ncbi:uncharacterized protein [Salmo salar]|uniref:Ig-like domain-containing protein n=1 Tax=Salmo salar TaxID=8030 RepID=A0ABM3EBP0_SALSA|nr:uncharacterized protein LOC106599637 [Salmo salar]